ncbi:MAG: hypothetical protein KatS3mg060_0108 [Dehalococcoidia bacterium]|nr:MAG: hypothetical protein KatS3mg060_0108 [Dehalococcoidia bacterium]
MTSSFEPDYGKARRCGNCAFFEPAPLNRMGWCRNPMLHAPHERALVADDEHRCKKMLTDHWQASMATQRTRQLPPSATQRATRTLRRVRPTSVPVPFIYAIVVMLVALGAATLFSMQTTRATVAAQQTKAQPAAIAKVDFWIRDDARSDALKKSIVLVGTSLELLDSRAGEVIDAAAAEPAKWYRIRVAATGETGWVYSGWVERRPDR